MEGNEVVAPVEPTEPAEPAAAEPADNTDEPSGAEPTEPEAPKPKENRVQARIDEITRARRNAEAEAEYWRNVATGGTKQPQQAAQPEPEALPPGFPTKPTIDQFDDYDQYVEALGEWSAEKTIAKREYAASRKQHEQAQQTVRETYSKRVEAAKVKYADWDEVVALSDVAVTNTTLDAILESEQGPDISYFLLTNPAEAARLRGLSQIQQIKEIAKLETKFAGATAPVKRVTQAPAPINAIGGSDKGILDMDKLEGEEWAKAERERVRKLGRRY